MPQDGIRGLLESSSRRFLPLPRMLDPRSGLDLLQACTDMVESRSALLQRKAAKGVDQPLQACAFTASMWLTSAATAPPFLSSSISPSPPTPLLP